MEPLLVIWCRFLLLLIFNPNLPVLSSLCDILLFLEMLCFNSRFLTYYFFNSLFLTLLLGLDIRLASILFYLSTSFNQTFLPSKLIECYYTTGLAARFPIFVLYSAFPTDKSLPFSKISTNLPMSLTFSFSCLNRVDYSLKSFLF